MYRKSGIPTVGRRIGHFTHNPVGIVGRFVKRGILRVFVSIRLSGNDHPRILHGSLIADPRQHLIMRQQHREIIMERHNRIGIFLGHPCILDVVVVLPAHCRDEYDPFGVLLSDCRQNLILELIPTSCVGCPVMRFVQQFKGHALRIVSLEFRSKFSPNIYEMGAKFGIGRVVQLLLPVTVRAFTGSRRVQVENRIHAVLLAPCKKFV